MKYICDLSYNAKDLPDCIKERAIELGIYNKFNYFIKLRCDFNAEALNRAASILKDAGLRPWTDLFRDRSASEFAMHVDREYSPHEISEASALLLFGGVADESPGWTADRRGVVNFKGAEDVLRDWDVVETFPPRYFARESFANLLPDVARDVVVHEAEVRNGEGQRWWEIDTPHTMPPLWHGMTTADWKGLGRPKPDFSTGFGIHEWVFKPVEFRYVPAGIEFLNDVGLARTLEPFGNFKERKPEYCPMLISGKAFRACKAAGIRLTGVPVRSSEDPTPPEELAIRRFWDW